MEMISNNLQNVIEYFYKFAFFVMLLFLLARYTAFSRLFFRKGLTRRQEIFLIATFGCISIISFMIFQEAGAPLFLPLYFGVYSGLTPGLGTSIILAAFIHIMGQPILTVLLCLAAGPIGAYLGTRIPPGERKPFYVPLLGALITLLGFSKGDTSFLYLIPDMISRNERWYLEIAFYLLVYVVVCYLLLHLLEIILSDEDNKKALQTNNILALVGNALDQIRNGISEENARNLCQSLKKALDIPGVCIISKDECLYFPGPTNHEYPSRTEPFKNIQRRLFIEGMVFEGDHRLIFGGCHQDCEFTNIFLLPLNDGQKTVSALGFIQSTRQAFSGSDQKLATGLSLIFSSELTRSKLEEQRIALESAKFKLLQAQINPHFLFNSLNTIAWMTGKDPEKAEELIIHLSNFLRQSFDVKGDFVTLRKEIEYLRSYLFIEKSRFMEKLQVNYMIDEGSLSYYIPPFLIQPLVENSIKHGISKKKDGGSINVIIDEEVDRIKVTVEDNGDGCSPERLYEILNTPPIDKEGGPRRGIGVFNVKERVGALFGSESKFNMESTPGTGTKVSFYLPKKGGDS